MSLRAIPPSLLAVVGTASLAWASCPASDAAAKARDAQKDSGVQMMQAAHFTETKADKSIVQTAVGNKDFSTLVAALKAADLVSALDGKGPFTVFAPTNEAFAKIDPKALEALLKDKAALQNILKYHVVSGEVYAKDINKTAGAVTPAIALNGQQIEITTTSGVMVDNAKVTATDIACSNGVIHVIDTVIMPATSDLVKTAVDAGQFKTLAAALEAAGLVSTLQGEGPFTVFAPTDAAFAKLPAGTVESLLKPENREKLKSILLYHVVPGRVYAADALAAKSAKTAQGSPVEIAIKNGKAMVNNAGLVKTDLDASNGVIHVIDTVIMPPEAAKK